MRKQHIILILLFQILIISFNELNSKLFLGIGTYHINNIPLEHPIGFVIDDTSLFEVISGSIFNQGEKTINDISMTYYTGNNNSSESRFWNN